MFICIFSLKEKKKGGGVCGPAREGWYHTFRPIVTINAGCKTWQSSLNGRLRNGGLHSRNQSAVVALGKLEGKLLFLYLFSGVFLLGGQGRRLFLVCVLFFFYLMEFTWLRFLRGQQFSCTQQQHRS